MGIHWLLDSLTVEDLKELSDQMTKRSYSAGEQIVAEGDPGHEAFVVLRGCVDVTSAALDPSMRLSRLGPGEHFGEQALLMEQAGVRSATVVAAEDTTLLVLQRVVLERALARDPQLLIHLLEVGSQQSQQFLRSSHYLKQIFLSQNETPAAEEKTYEADTVIFHAGDSASDVYFLMEGEVEIVSPKSKRLHVVTAGECFGEIGVMLDLPRNATAKTLTQARMARLGAYDFNLRVSGVDRMKRIMFRLWRGYHFDSDYVKQFGDKLSESGQLTTLVQLERARLAVVTRDPTRPGYKAKVVGLENHQDALKTVCWGGTANQPWFRVQLVQSKEQRVIQSIVTTIERPETAALYELLVEGAPLTNSMVEALAQTGMARPLRKGRDDWVCRCLKVPRERVDAAIASGCRSVASVATETGCGTVCGACKTDVAAMLVSQLGYSQAEAASVPVDQRVFATSWLDGLMFKAGPVAAKLWGLLNYVRPGFVTLGIVIAPFLVVVDPLRGGIFFGLLAALFAYDVVLARRQWREVFVDLLEGGVEIGEDEQRVEGFSEDNNSGPRNVVMRRLPFWQWVRYKYTLRQDYVLNSTWRWARHQVRSFCLDRGMASARRWHPRAQPFWGDTERELGELCIETSLCLGVVGIGDDDEGRRVAIFRFVDWLCPAGTEVEGEVLPVAMLEVQVDLNTRTATACSLNGESLGVGRDALCVLYLALSGYHHTVLHAYANWAAIPHHDDPYIRRGANWTLSTNAVALYTGRVCQHDPRSMERVLKYNGRRGMARHGSGKFLHEVAEHSRYARFVLRAREVFIQTLVAYELEIDIEALFLMTVVHSLDHHTATLAVDPHDLVPSNSDHRAAQMVRLIFSEPLEPVLVNTKLASIKAGWPKALYDRLVEVDAELARVVDLGIAY